jgi:hypothetical protein
MKRPMALGGLVALVGCAAPAAPEVTAPEEIGEVALSLSSVSCKAKTEKGYQAGKPFDIEVVTIDDELVERNTANAYIFMAKAAAADGVEIRIVSGFRTMAEQQYLYNCYVNCNCNNCNLAAKPGYSNHQSGSALDLNTSAAGVYGWLDKHAGDHGFVRTVPSEKWHWEYKGALPVGGPCGVLDAKVAGAWSDAEPDATGEADYAVCAMQSFRMRFTLANDGTARWTEATSPKHAGEDVALFSEGGVDALTGLETVGVAESSNGNVLPESWGGGAGKDCDDADGCRRTVLTTAGLEATAPAEPGIVTSSWRLRDRSPLWSEPKAFGEPASLRFRVSACDPPPSPDTPRAPGSAEGILGPAAAGPGTETHASDEAAGCALQGQARGRGGWLLVLFLFALRRRRAPRP